MESPKQFESKESSPEEVATQTIVTFGIGHMPHTTPFSPQKIRVETRTEVMSSYAVCIERAHALVASISNSIAEINTEQRSPEVFHDLVNGVSEALLRTANQILYHAAYNPDESLEAFDELHMVLEAVDQSFNSPHILKKKEYIASAIYELAPPQHVESFDVQDFNTLFSKDHIAFNFVSRPKYKDVEKTIKSGVRLDYGPLYKETPEGIDKTKTEWQTSVDVSGYYIDKVMNRYSPRGHHFTDVFDHKIHLLMQAFAGHMEQRFDSHHV